MTDPSIALDIAGIAGPLVDLAFGLSGGVSVQAAVTIVGTRTVDARADTVTNVGGYTFTVPAILYAREDKDSGDPQAMRDAMLVINPSDMAAAGVPANVRIRTNDKVVANGNTWTVIAIKPVPGDIIYQLRLRR